MFVVDAFVLKKQAIKDGVFVLHLLTKDFGKITAWLKGKSTKKPLDIGQLIHCKLTRKWKQNIIKEYKIKQTLDYTKQDYHTVHSILLYISDILLLVPENMPYTNVYNDFYSLFNQEISVHFVQLLRLKLIVLYGIQQPAKIADNKELLKSIKNMNSSQLFELSRKKDTKNIETYVDYCISHFTK